MEHSAIKTAASSRISQGYAGILLTAFVSITLPLLLVMFNVRLVMTPMFLNFEYLRPDFPEDFYGFSQEDRLNYAPYALNYLIYAEDITYLADLEFPNGRALYTARELRHMRDVQTLTQITFVGTLGLGLFALAAAYVLRRSGRLGSALFRGALLTLGIIVSIVIAAVINWDFFFTGFHTIFFESDTWYFAYSDTLIRLFPEQFWFDAALLIGTFTSLEAIGILILTWYINNRTSTPRQTVMES